MRIPLALAALAFAAPAFAAHFGQPADPQTAARTMLKHAHMEHEDEHMAHVRPGRTGRIGWRFTRAGEYYYACLIPGHFEAGMIGKVIVAP